MLSDTCSRRYQSTQVRTMNSALRSNDSEFWSVFQQRLKGYQSTVNLSPTQRIWLIFIITVTVACKIKSPHKPSWSTKFWRFAYNQWSTSMGIHLSEIPSRCRNVNIWVHLKVIWQIWDKFLILWGIELLFLGQTDSNEQKTTQCTHRTQEYPGKTSLLEVKNPATNLNLYYTETECNITILLQQQITQNSRMLTWN